MVISELKIVNLGQTEVPNRHPFDIPYEQYVVRIPEFEWLEEVRE